MEYICHKRYKKTGASGEEYNFPYGTKLRTVGTFIANGPEAVCSVKSEDAYMYWARNDDGQGLMRGMLTHAIAYSHRKPNKDNGFRFTPEEIEILEKEYPHFLRQDTDTIIFNHEFFNAEVDELKKMADRLEVRHVSGN